MEEIVLRSEDFWEDVAHDLNALAIRIREESDLRSELQQLFPAAQDGAATELHQPVPASSESLEELSDTSESSATSAPAAPLDDMRGTTEEALNAC